MRCQPNLQQSHPNTYALDGGHPSEQYVMDVRPGGWVVYYPEGGLESGLQEFDTEDAACDFLLDQLRNDPTTHFHLVVGPLPAADADKTFEAWKSRTGLVDIAQSDVRVDEPIFANGPLRRYWVRGTLLPPG